MGRLLFILLFATSAWSDTARPNIVLIVTDDLDLVLGGMQPLAFTQQLVGNRGATFVNAFTSSPICCPSRASILTGQYAHNHRTFNNSDSGGCYGAYWRKAVEPATFPKQLQEEGYRTFYAGKYLNEYKAKELPPGWSEWAGLRGNSRYRDFVLNENGRAVTYGGDSYLTDVLTNKTNEFLSRTSTPFFAMVAPPAPHAPFDPASRHSGRFNNVSAPRTPNFNAPSGPLDKHWLLTMPPDTLSGQVVGHIDEIYRKRWETLLAVDEMVENIVSSLQRRNLLDDTYIVFTSDNGYHMGQNAQAFDKRQPYDTDIRVPLLVAGPNIPAKSLVQAPVALIDLAPTILEWAGIRTNDKFDGESFASLLNAADQSTERQILIEYWGEGNEYTHNPECPWRANDRLNQCTKDADCHCQDSWNNTYSCVRHLAVDINVLYCEFRDEVDFVEAYDLSADLYQMTNLGFDMLPSMRAMYSLAVAHLERCANESCRRVY